MLTYSQSIAINAFNSKTSFQRWLSVVISIALLIASPLSFSASSTAEATSEHSSESAAANSQHWSDYTVRKGDNLSVIFKRVGLKNIDALEVFAATQQQKTFVKLIPGETMRFLIKEEKLQQIRYQISKDTVRVITKSTSPAKYSLSTEILEPQQQIVKTIKAQAATPAPAITTETAQVTLDKQTTETPEPAKVSAAQPEKPQLAAVLAKEDSNDQWFYYTVKPRDNLSAIFLRAGHSSADLANVINAASKKSFNNMQVGDKVGFASRDGFLIKVNYIHSPLKNTVYTRTSNTQYSVEVFEKKPVTEFKTVSGSINNSFIGDATQAGLSNNVAMNFTKVFGWDIDFSQDVMPGDKFKVVYEELTIDGTKIRNGNIVAAELEVSGQVLTGIFYKDSNGDPGFYTPEGHSMRKAFLRMPVELARISSKFNLRRKHPIWKTIRAHKGVDYAAKRGTPIMASGNGKIIYRGRRGEFGNTIIIKHGSGIETLYAHMSGFNKSLSLGSRVVQGQVIGYVGSTGAVTGAHLHYEFRVDGVHKNPLTVKLTRPAGLAPDELTKFKVVAKQALEKLNANSAQKIASNPIESNVR